MQNHDEQETAHGSPELALLAFLAVFVVIAYLLV